MTALAVMAYIPIAAVSLALLVTGYVFGLLEFFETREWWREVMRPMCGVCGEPWEVGDDARSLAKNIHHTCRPIVWRREKT